MAQIRIVDADGHIFEDTAAMGKRMPKIYRDWKYAHGLFASQPWFPPLGHLHTPTGKNPKGAFGDGKPVGVEEWMAFIDATGIERAVLFPSSGLTYGHITNGDYAIAVARAYNDWLAETYVDRSDVFQGMGLIPMQEPEAAIEELRRCVVELNMTGIMLAGTGLKGHLGSKEYWPVYAEAERLGCPLAVHGGNHIGFGMDDMNVFAPAHAIGHPLAMMIGLGGLVFNGVFDKFPGLRIGFLESGVAWLLFCIERFDSSHETITPLSWRDELLQLPEGQTIRDYILGLISKGQIFVGCEGDELTLAAGIKTVGNAPFMFSSDFPHEVNTEKCLDHLEEIFEHKELSDDDRNAILHGNADRFYTVRPESAGQAAAE
jgi:predicted TIM-barrel fold metal-dependent hydrolase